MSFLKLRIHRTALQLPTVYICRQCLQRPSPQLPSRIAQLARGRSYATPHLRTTPLSSVSQTISSGSATGSSTASATGTHKRGFPETSPPSVGYWLLGSAASVFGIVVFGGLTRLTESGLSITEWRPVTGSLPPLSAADWDAELTKYRASPEFAQLNPHMTLPEFKKIYYMEWTHRLWGRFIGLTFVLPTLYLVARRGVPARTALHLGGISTLIGFQGFLGWWMVKSGLTDDLFAPGSHPRVSQYRLAAHLGTAFVCYGWMLLTGLRVLRASRLARDPAAAAALLAQLQRPAVRPFRLYAAGVTGLVFLTALSGALVAGLDAGLIYNEFPRMGLGLAPPAAELWSRFYARRADAADLWWRNMLENPSLVQLEHRILATTTFCAVVALFVWSRRGRAGAALSREAKKGALGALHLVLLQAALGISTLIYMVPVYLAATHQAGSLALLTGMLVLGHRLRIPRSAMRVAQKRLKEMAALKVS